MTESPKIPLLDLSLANDPTTRPALLSQLYDALFNVGFLYIQNHSIPTAKIEALTSRLPSLFDIPNAEKARLSKTYSPHFLGYSGFAEETTLGKRDLREQFDFATELPVVWAPGHSSPAEQSRRDFSRLYWRLRGPNQWPEEALLLGFRAALTEYHDAVQDLSYQFVHLVEEAIGIPIGTFDEFFSIPRTDGREVSPANTTADSGYLPPQHRIKLVKYPPSRSDDDSQGVGAHKDSSGWLTFLYQVGKENGLEVLGKDGSWIPAPPIPGTFVVNFGNAFEAATDGAVKATVHRVVAPSQTSPPRYSIPFFQGLPLDLTVSEIRGYIPDAVRRLRKDSQEAVEISSFLDPRWDSLGESQLRKWIRSHEDVARRHYGDEVVEYYIQ